MHGESHVPKPIVTNIMIENREAENVQIENREWNLILVNSSHPIDEDYIMAISLTQLKNGQSVDSRCYPDLQRMMDDCRAEGYNPIICSSFRTNQKQQNIFNQQVNTYMKKGG